MPEPIVPASSEGDTSPATAPAANQDQKGDSRPAPPTPKATVENRPQRSSDAFDAIYAETEAELAEKDKPAAPPVDEPEEKDEPKEEPKKADEPEEDDKEPEDKPDDKPAEATEAEEKTVAEQILELMKNPELLESALRQAGVETIQELPFVKDLVGRSTQSALDIAKAQAAKEAFEAKQVDAVLEKGRKAATEVVDIIEKLSHDLEDGAEEFKVPETEYLVQKFNEYADGAVHAYHNKNFGEIAETVYNYPEMKGLSPEQQEYLSSFNGKPPAEWLDAHLQVQRNNLWNLAQSEVANQAAKLIEDRTKALEEAHKLDLAKATEKHEKAIAKVTEKVKTDTRAEVLAEFANKGAPPRVTPTHSPVATDPDDIDVGDGSFESIFRGVKSAMEKNGGV